ncbi:MAG TPA: UvrD-helicase domain-containing protein, partial [Candidatus Obscuribacterales bacterium]
MAFLIPDDLKSKRVIPSSIRKVAEAFQIALDDDATIWYQPLFDAKQRQPHLVILLAGRGIAVIEVLGLSSQDVLGVFRQKIRLQKGGREVEVDNPLERAEQLAVVLRKGIAGESRLNGISLPVAAMAAFPDVSRKEAEEKELSKIINTSHCFFKEDVDAALEGNGEARILKVFARALGPSQSTFRTDQEKIIRAVIQPDTRIENIKGSAIAATSCKAKGLAVAESASAVTQLHVFNSPLAGDDHFSVLDRRQEAMAKSFGDGHRIIRGVAGSGKTLLLVYRAKLLARNFPRKRYLITCFTRALAGQLRESVKDFHNVDVQHLDGLMRDIINQAGLQHPGYDDKTGEAVVETALKALDQGAGPRYHAVLVDEAQDFSTPALQFARKLLCRGCNDLVIVADAAQNIFRRRFNWKSAGIQAQGRTRMLRVNYRNTKEILSFASRFLLANALENDNAVNLEDENSVIPPKHMERSGRPPKVIVAPNGQREIAETVRQVKQWLAEFNVHDKIAVLYSTTVENGFKR